MVAAIAPGNLAAFPPSVEVNADFCMEQKSVLVVVKRLLLVIGGLLC
jgi:hypothetical protein